MTEIEPEIDTARSGWRELLRFLPDLFMLLLALARDERVPWPAKATAGVAVVYAVSPIDLVPDFIPGLGRLDDLYVALWAIRTLCRAAGVDVLRELWQGTDDGFALLLLALGLDTSSWD